MKAIKLNSRIYKVVKELGSFIYYIDEKGKNRCVNSKGIEIVESNEVEKTESSVKVKKLNKANFMSNEEYLNSAVAKMSDEEWRIYRERKVKDSLQSSLR